METERIAPEHRQLQVHASQTVGMLPVGRLYMTGDLRALTGLPRTHMDFYLREGIIQPTTRTGSGYLLFDHGELETLRGAANRAAWDGPYPGGYGVNSAIAYGP